MPILTKDANYMKQNSLLGVYYKYPVTAMQLFPLQKKLNEKKSRVSNTPHNQFSWFKSKKI